MKKLQVSLWFQSSPGPKAGRYGDVLALVFTGLTEFQSSPGPKAGRYRKRAPQPDVLRETFQSSPGPKAGRYARMPIRAPFATSPFQSSPGPKAGRYPAGPPRAAHARRVSILARPEGRALPPRRWAMSPWRSSFNPRPARRPGATAQRPRLPPRRRGVSILARPEGRALRALGSAPSSGRRSFNPRPARRPGATLSVPQFGGTRPRFWPNCRSLSPQAACRHARRPNRGACGRPKCAGGGTRSVRRRFARRAAIQKTSGPRWSNGSATPNDRRCRRSGSRKR